MSGTISLKLETASNSDVKPEKKHLGEVKTVRCWAQNDRKSGKERIEPVSSEEEKPEEAQIKGRDLGEWDIRLEGLNNPAGNPNFFWWGKIWSIESEVWKIDNSPQQNEG